MPRRRAAERREISPDARYGNRTLAVFINKVMRSGKKGTAERQVYAALDRIEREGRRAGLDTFEQAIRNAMPLLEVKPRRVGGATYQVPVDIRQERRLALAMRWLIRSARARAGRSFSEKLAAELLDAANGQGATIRRKDETHRMAEANRAFVHYRW